MQRVMNVANRLIAIALGLAAVGSAYPTVLDDNAKDLLLRSMEHAYKVNVRAVVVQRCAETNALQHIKIEQTKSGLSRYTILLPIQEQGVESVDDGMRAVTYLPNHKVVLIQDSSRHADKDAKKRLALAEANYQLSWQHSRRVAGRETICVTAVPKHGSLEKRKFYIDSKTAYLLRFETVGRDGRTSLKYDTKSVSYPSSMEDPGISPNAVGVSTVRSHRRACGHRDQAVAEAGISPLIPDRLPLGFVIRESEITRTSNWKAVAIRVTDGLVKGTVYEWRPTAGSDDEAVAPDRTMIQARGLKLMMVADIPEAARMQILRTFALADVQSLRDAPRMEPPCASETFKNVVGWHSEIESKAAKTQ